MTKTTKDKLLEILGDFAADELSMNGLLEVLEDRLERQDEEIKRLKAENAGERERLYFDREALHREIKEVRRNPNILISLQEYFRCQNGDVIEVTMHRGQLQACEHIGKAKVKYVMPSIPANEAFK